MKTIIITLTLYLISSMAQASYCNLAKIGENGFPFDFQSAEYVANQKLNLVTPSQDYTAEISKVFLDSDYYTQLTLKNDLISSSAVFMDTNPHPYLTIVDKGVNIQVQCWLD